MDIINDILDNYRIRFFPNQKKKFRNYIIDQMTGLGYEVKIINNNIVIGDVSSSNKIYTAHYDTPGTLNILLVSVFKLIGVNRQVLASIIIFLLILIPTIFNLYSIVFLINILLLIFLIQIFIPNSINYNDNTSGVIGVLLLAVKYSKIKSKDVAFILFNNEEWGLLGSKSYKRYLKKKDISLEGKFLINLDCIGVGDRVLITYGNAENLASEVKRQLSDELSESIDLYKYRILPLSDEFIFRRENAIGIFRINQSIIPGGFYIPNMHTKRDNKIELDYIDSLTDCLMLI